MKKILFTFCFAALILPVYATEVEIPKPESVRYFSQPQDPRFQYDLPSAKNFSFKKNSNSKNADDSYDEITLDEQDVKPVKKVIKKLGDTPTSSEETLSPQDVPMNYESFPKYYDGNDLIQQQFMPTF